MGQSTGSRTSRQRSRFQKQVALAKQRLADSLVGPSLYSFANRHSRRFVLSTNHFTAACRSLILSAFSQVNPSPERPK